MKSEPPFVVGRIALCPHDTTLDSMPSGCQQRHVLMKSTPFRYWLPLLSVLIIPLLVPASVGLDDQQRMEQPNAGAVFAIRLEGVKGIPEPRFRG